MKLLAGWLVLLALASLTSIRLSEWQTDRVLWAAAARIAPLSVRVHVNLRAAAIGTGDWEAAIEECSVLRQLPVRSRLEAHLIIKICDSH